MVFTYGKGWMRVLVSALLVSVSSSVFAEKKCETVNFFYDQSDEQNITLRLNVGLVKDYIRELAGLSLVKKNQVFFLRLANIEGGNIDELEDILVFPSNNLESIEENDAYCEPDLHDESKLVCGIYLAENATLAFVFHVSEKANDSKFSQISIRIANALKPNLICD